jgi:E-phenylitaconyl-CoA hydratase
MRTPFLFLRLREPLNCSFVLAIVEETSMPAVKYEKEEKIAFITLNRPERLNAIDLETTEELIKIWINFRDDDQLWVAILSGEGRSFCAGADVDKMTLGGIWNVRKSLIYGKKKMGPSNYKVWKPIIAAVHGYVLGAGFYLALECDLIIAAENAEFGLPEPNLGIPTLFASSLRNYLSPCLVMELLLVADRINAKRAYDIGLVNRVVSRDLLLDSAKSMAERICQNGPLSLRAMKEVFQRSREMDSTSKLTLLEQIFTPVMNSEDAAEGKRAFQEKRKPQWKCR